MPPRRLAQALLALAALLLASPPAAAEPPIPPSNAADRPEPALKDAPAEGDAAERAALLVQALREDNPDLALPFFFPQDAFRQVKGIKDPDRYFKRLIDVYRADLQAMRASLKDPDHVTFVRFSLGRQRRWVQRGKEANDLPYWANYKASIVVLDAGRERTLPVRVLITWDDRWYVTHLTNK